MEKIHSQLLACLAAFAAGSPRAELVPDMENADWENLFALAGHHKLEAVVYGTLGRTPGFCGGDGAAICRWRQRAYSLSAAQSRRTARLLQLTAALDGENIPYAVVKGIVCRSLYQNGDLRISGDEDFFITAEHYPACAQVLERTGFQLRGGQIQDVTHWYDGAGLHIELHTRLCREPQAQAIFTDFTPQRLEVPGGSLLTMPDTLHLAFLLYHARKHLITGGVGIRTLCDIAMFYRSRKDSLDQAQLRALLEQLSCSSLMRHILTIGRDALGIGCDGLELPNLAEDLLADVLDAGIYGQSSLTRRHSGALLAQQLRGKQGLLRTLFPDRETVQARYPVLKDKPGRLPLMWLKRLVSYGAETLSKKDSSPTASLQMSKKRMEMLVEYDIISKLP